MLALWAQGRNHSTVDESGSEKRKLCIFLNNMSTVGTRDQLRALQTQEEVIKENSVVILVKDASAVSIHKGAIASAAGASKSDKSKLCISVSRMQAL